MSAHEALITARYASEEEAERVFAAVRIDDDAHVATQHADLAIVVRARGSSVASLRRAVDDALMCLQVAEDVLRVA